MLWSEGERPVFRIRQVRVQIQERGEITPYGGLSLAHDLAMRLGIDRDINESIPLLRLHLPCFESDHLLTQVYNQYVGGFCIEDIAHLQHSDAVKHLTGACRIPDSSTAGDFLRRFNRLHLRACQQMIDRAREKVWRQMPNSRKQVATIDMDSTLRDRILTEAKHGSHGTNVESWCDTSDSRDAAERTDDYRGYRNGSTSRQLTLGAGTIDLAVPRVRDMPVGQEPFESKIVHKHQRRSDTIDATFLNLFLEGLATRNFEPALRLPVGQDVPLSPSTISRLTG